MSTFLLCKPWTIYHTISCNRRPLSVSRCTWANCSICVEEKVLNMFEEQLQIAAECLRFARVPEVSCGFDRPLQASDFLQYQSVSEDVLEKVIRILEKVDMPQVAEGEWTRLISNVLIVAGEHSAWNPWTTDNSLGLSEKLISTVVSKANVPCVSVLMTYNNQRIFKSMLESLRPRLLVKTWKKNPGAVLCYAWMLQHIKSPHLSDHLSKVLPTALIITDDFEAHNRITGLTCLHHIVENVAKADMTMYNFHEVIIEALRPILYHGDPEVITPLIKTYVALMSKLNPQHPVTDLTRNVFDDIFEIILKNMYLEQTVELRTTYIECLPLLIKAKGLSTLRHGDLIYKILEEYILESSCSELALQALSDTLKVTWPKKRWVFESTMKIMLKLIHNYTKNRSELSPPMIAELKSILATLTALSPEDAKSLIEAIREDSDIDEFYATVLSFFPKTEDETL